jgi:hypothetical protein
MRWRQRAGPSVSGKRTTKLEHVPSPPVVKGEDLEMACYLCAYKSPKTPETQEPLDDDSSASPTEELGACFDCGVFACSQHGTRYRLFKCAICKPATVVAQVLAPQPLAAVTGFPPVRLPLHQAAFVGRSEASPEVFVQMRGALDRIRRDQEQAISSLERNELPPGPNIVFNFPSIVAAQADTGPSEDLRSIGDAIAERFAVPVRRDLSPNDVFGVLGALAMAYDVADDGSMVSAGGLEIRRRDVPPWRVSHPGLLDPAIWLVGTAYYQ